VSDPDVFNFGRGFNLAFERFDEPFEVSREKLQCQAFGAKFFNSSPKVKHIRVNLVETTRPPKNSMEK
jgi:hypothetical protein